MVIHEIHSVQMSDSGGYVLRYLKRSLSYLRAACILERCWSVEVANRREPLQMQISGLDMHSIK